MAIIGPATLPPFADMGNRIRLHARQAPRRRALVEGERRLDHAALDRQMDRIAAALQRDGAERGEAVAVCAANSIEYACVFLGALRAGVVVAPLAPGATPASLQRMLADADAKLLLTTGEVEVGDGGPARIALDGSAAGHALDDWLAGCTTPRPVAIDPEAALNIIYSTGTTGEPKGIVQSHAMRWAYAARGARYGYGYGADTVTLLATPLYSNTMLVVFFPTLAFGGTVVLMAKFEAQAYPALAQAQRVTQPMLVPVQYERLLALPPFDRHDLSSFRYKFSTSAPFAATLKAEVLRRWPGALIEFYGMTEGGGSCILEAHLFPDKLHTVGTPAPGHEIRLIDEAGREVGPGEAGEIVGHSAGMMSGYHQRPEATHEAEWFDASGKRFIRVSDVGRFDADGFLTLLDRRKDVIISGGFNLYPSDLEAVLREHAALADVAIVGVPIAPMGRDAGGICRASRGLRRARRRDAAQWANARLGKTQHLHALRSIDAVPRSPIGEVLNRDLREWHGPV